MQLFFEPEILTKPILHEEESAHAIRVLRHKVGDVLQIVDGKGRWVQAKITEILKKECKLQVLSVENDYQKPKYDVHIAIAPTKNMERMEWFVEKATEQGVQQISFLLCQKSERKELKLNRLEKVAINAMKQSKQAYLPQLNALMSLETFLQDKFEQTQCYVAHVDFENTIYLQKEPAEAPKSLVLIGPEGDFSDSEIDKIVKKGFKKISLGNTVLRTETAGVLAANILINKYL